VANQGMADAGGRFARQRRAAEPVRRRHDVNRRWYLLLLLPLLGTLIPPIYNHEDPQVFGIPFFYWYQMVWIAASVACTIVVYRRTRGDR
jgi:Protein of unknown function (DUF3311)